MKNPLGVLKEHKEVALMIFGTLTEVGAVVLAVRNGIKAKEKLDEMPEDATFTEKAITIAPEVLPVVGLASLSIGSYWWARHINIDRIISASSVAAMAIQNKKNQDEAVKETVDEKTYSDIQERAVEKSVEEKYSPHNKIVYRSNNPEASLFVDGATGLGYHATQGELDTMLLRWKQDIANSPDKEYIDEYDLYANYLKVPRNSGVIRGMDCLGWHHTKIQNLHFVYTYPSEDPDSSRYGKPYTIFRFSEWPEEIIPFR